MAATYKSHLSSIDPGDLQRVGIAVPPKVQQHSARIVYDAGEAMRKGLGMYLPQTLELPVANRNVSAEVSQGFGAGQMHSYGRGGVPAGIDAFGQDM